jgi:putative salt-induced outer membrane protein YdiY
VIGSVYPEIEMARFGLVTGLASLCLGLAGAGAHAELPQAYQALLDEAADRQGDDARFLETADMVSVLVDGGRGEVHAYINEHLPHRAGAVAEWPMPAPTPAPTPAPAPASAPAASPEPNPAPAPAEHEEHRSLGGAPVALSGAPEGSGGWLAGSISALTDDSWAGHIRAGVQLERGNSQLTDFTFAFELDRELDDGWRIDSQFEYFLSESATRTTRDNWLVELRTTRELDSGIGYYAGGSYERDLIGIYERSAFLTAGGIWHAVDSEKANWVLRAGVGQRFREDRLTGETLTDWVGEAGSSFHYQISETASLGSETTAFAGGGSRVDQRFTLTNRLFGNWAVQTGLRIEHEFEERPGFDPTDTRLDISLLWAFD